MRESNQVRKLLIASAVIVLSIPAITSAAPEEAKSQLSLVDALNAGQATAGKAVTLEDFEGGSGREQVFIPGKRADPAAAAAAIGQLPIEQHRFALDKKIGAQLKAAESGGAKITATQRVTVGSAVRVEDAVAIIDVRRVEAFTAGVSYSDLDLSTEAGLSTLYSRLQRASNAVCGLRSLGKAGSLRQSRYNKQCYRDVLSRVVAKFNSTKLDEIHAAPTKSASSSSTNKVST